MSIRSSLVRLAAVAALAWSGAPAADVTPAPAPVLSAAPVSVGMPGCETCQGAGGDCALCKHGAVRSKCDVCGKLLGSNLGDGSSHSTKNLPVFLAGGGFKHGQHQGFDPNSPPPLCNLYVSMLQRLGIETEKFGTSTGTLTGLEFNKG